MDTVSLACGAVSEALTYLSGGFTPPAHAEKATGVTEPIRILELCALWGLGGTALDCYIRAVHLNRDLFQSLAVGYVDGGPWLNAARATRLTTATCDACNERLEQVFADFRPHLVHYVRMSSTDALIVTAQRLCRKYGAFAEVETNMFGRPARDAGLSPPNLVRHVSQASMLRYAGLAGTTMEQLYARGDRTVYIPILADRFAGLQLTPEDRETFRKRLGVRPEEVLACRVGRADLRKWSQRLEYAIPRMLDAVPHLRYVFQTAPPSKVESLRKRYGDRVLCLPMTADPTELGRLYHACDLMIHSSAIGESFGCSVAEGMYWRLPVVVDSTPEVDNAQIELVDHGETGLVVLSVTGFVEAVKKLAGDSQERRRLGEAGHVKAARLYSESAVTALWEKYYVELLDRVGCPAVTERHRARGGQVNAPDEINETAWEARYAARLGKYVGPRPGLGERITLGFGSARDVVAFAREIGPIRVWNVLRDRLKAGRIMSRA